MLMHIIQLIEDDSYEFGSGVEPSDAYISMSEIESVTEDEEDENRCYVYMKSQDHFNIMESMDSFVSRYQAMLYGSVMTKFYDSTNKQS